jgi:hypothetical protein
MAWTIEDPIVVNSVKTAKITGYAQELEAFDLSECIVERGPDTEHPERLELWLQHTPAAAFIASIDTFALAFLMSNVQRFFNEPLSPMQVLERYTPALATLGGDLPLLVARLGADAPCEQLDLPDSRPESWSGLVVNPVFDIRSLWFTEDACGLNVEVLELEYDFRMYAW